MCVCVCQCVLCICVGVFVSIITEAEEAHKSYLVINFLYVLQMTRVFQAFTAYC